MTLPDHDLLVLTVAALASDQAHRATTQVHGSGSGTVPGHENQGPKLVLAEVRVEKLDDCRAWPAALGAEV